MYANYVFRLARVLSWSEHLWRKFTKFNPWRGILVEKSATRFIKLQVLYVIHHTVRNLSRSRISSRVDSAIYVELKAPVLLGTDSSMASRSTTV